MIDSMIWKNGICDICRKDESNLQPKLVGIMEKGQWVGGYSREKSKKAKEIRQEWEREISRPCLRIRADMDEVCICEDHLLYAMTLKDTNKYIDFDGTTKTFSENKNDFDYRKNYPQQAGFHS